jgi:hypothetical protein
MVHEIFEGSLDSNLCLKQVHVVKFECKFEHANLPCRRLFQFETLIQSNPPIWSPLLSSQVSTLDVNKYIFLRIAAKKKKNHIFTTN